MGGTDCSEVADCPEVANSRRQRRADYSDKGEPTVKEPTNQPSTIIIIGVAFVNSPYDVLV